MAQQSFIFGGNTGVSYDEMQRQRELAQALAGRVTGSSPSNIGEGLSAIGAALASRKYRQRATEAESLGRAQAAEQFGKIAQVSGIDPSLMDAYNNPYMSEGQKSVVNALVSQKLNPPAPKEAYSVLTPEEEIQMGLDPKGTYQRGSVGGKIDTIGGSGTTVNVGGGNEYDKELAKRQAGDYYDMQKSGREAQKNLNTLFAMKQLAQTPGFYSGTSAEAVAAAKRMAVSMGLDPNGVGSMEAFNGLAKGAALASMGGSLGSGFSNADRDFVMGQVPALENSPEGNAMIIEIQSRMAQRQIDIARLAQQYQNKNGRLDAGFDEELAAYAEANPVFEDMDFGNGPLPEGVTEEEVSSAMEKYRLTRQQVLDELKKRQRQPQPQGGMY